MLNKWKKVDWSIVFIVFIFGILSVVLIHSGVAAWPKFKGYETKMLFFYIAGFIAFFGMMLVDFRLLTKYFLYLFGAGVLLMVVVIFNGSELNGAKGWLDLGFVSLQPAELFKLILIITLTALLMRKYRLRLSFWRDVVPLGLVTMIPFALAMVQNDIGNGLSYLVILLGLLWIGKLKYSHALIILIVAAVTITVGVKTYITFHEQISTTLKQTNKQHWLNRIDPWLLPEKADKDASYHTKNATVAIAAGGMFGSGYMQGAYVQSGRVPYTYSDSIFVVVAEEFGFFGCSVLLLLYFILIHRLILISLECKDKSGPLLIVGIVAMWLYQIFENIGMFMGLMPLTGITLPFISYGGTSLLINMASLGLAMSVRIHGHEVDDDIPRTSKAALSRTS
ncbi:FtsW/RodA/SpoVE family cell cycle protein [Paenibacillus sp. YPG26]|uniref:FtsW/RodA/SpoVE family cell cycle protein n=1 Tax=Paenibacillus sp. YPG26 TaxID=2878915 RepID=UPI00203C6F26|nr:FtsW/RodA/SpoVE family cell cycle protein [Paenibacillus sp. YPG26]USB32898.1 rod shape-determining protein RodA [Paenibacillus sp. YPG26]